MIQTVITPDKTIFDMTVSLPEAYVGKEVHVLFYLDDEVKQTTNSVLPKKKPSDFFGTQVSKKVKKCRNMYFKIVMNGNHNAIQHLHT